MRSKIDYSKGKFGNDGSISSRIQKISTKELALEVGKLFSHRNTMPLLKRIGENGKGNKINHSPRLLSQKKQSTPLNLMQIFKNSKIATPIETEEIDAKTPIKSCKSYFPTGNSPSSLIANLRRIDDRANYHPFMENFDKRCVNYKKAFARLVSVTHQYMTNNSPPRIKEKKIGPYFL